MGHARQEDDVSYFSLEYIGFWKGLTQRVILIQSDLKEMTTVLRLMEAISLSCIVVVNRRTPKDDSEDKRKQLVDQLQQELSDLNPQHAHSRIYYIHAQDPERNQEDWLALMTLLIGSTDEKHEGL